MGVFEEIYAELVDGKHNGDELFVVPFATCLDKLARRCQAFGRHKGKCQILSQLEHGFGARVVGSRCTARLRKMCISVFVVNSVQSVHHCVHDYTSRVTCKSVSVSKLLHSMLVLDGCEESYVSFAGEVKDCALVAVRVAIILAINFKVYR